MQRVESLPHRRLGVSAEPWALGIATLGFGLFYWLIGASQLNRPTDLDPWYYTGLFRNFGYMYRAFEDTYYASRLPWIIPGRVVNSLLPPAPAALLLHSVFLLTAAGAAYVVVRRFFGPNAALAAYAALLLNLIFYDAYTNDYPDGAQVTYLLLAFAFAFAGRGAGRAHLARLAAAGFFAAAALGTNLFDIVLVGPIVLAYLVFTVFDRTGALRALLDLGAALLGAVLLLVVVGSYASAYGGEFLFFMPSVRALSKISADVKIPGRHWILGEPRLLIPIFCVVLAAVVLAISGARARWRSDPSVRFVGAAATYLASITLVIYIWEFAFGGAMLDVPYYFSLFSPGIALTLGGCLGLIAERARIPGSVLVAAVVVAGTLPVVVAYTAHPAAMFGRRGAIITLVLMAGGVAAAPLFRRRRLAALALVMLAVAAPTYAAAASISTNDVFREGASIGAKERSLSLADQLMSFMRVHRLQSTAPGAQPPVFWYDAAADPSLIGIQSTYLFGWTWVGLAMPKVDGGLLKLLHDRRPQTIVLLCTDSGCAGGPGALRGARVTLRPAASARLESGGHRVWVRAFTLPRYSIANERLSYYDTALPLSPLGFEHTRQAVRFDRGVPAGWQNEAAAAGRGGDGIVVRTTPSRFAYQLLGPKVELPPGRYHALIAGRVVSGGLILGVLDATKDSWISQGGFSSQQHDFDTKTMAVGFTLAKPTTVQLILSNWAPVDSSSRWIVRRAGIVGS